MFSPVRLEEDYDNAWMGLGDTSQIKVDNPLLQRTKEDFDRPDEYLLDLMRKPENFGFTVQHLFGRTLAPFQLAVLRELWKRPFPMFIASRGASKSFLLALYSMLRALFDQGSRIVIVGAAFRQAKVEFDYCQDLWESSPVYRSLVGSDRRNGPRRDIDRCSLRVADSIINVFPLGDGCLRGDTLVTYGDRFGTISDNAGLDTITTTPGVSIWGNGEMRLTDEAYRNGVKPTKIVRTASGFEFEGTHNHRMKVCRMGKVCWVRSDEIRVGDWLLIDRSFRWHSGQNNVTQEEAYALGAMIGEALPPDILSAPRKSMSACLRGLFDNDGHIQVCGRDATISFTNTSRVLIRQMQYVLLHYGIAATVKFNDRARAYELQITGEDVNKFAEHIGFSSPCKKTALAKKSHEVRAPADPDIYYDEVVSVTDGECETFDVHVPDGHEYCANGFFSHNTKIRGQRASITIATEFASIPKDIFETVVRGFGAVASSPVERMKRVARSEAIKRKGLWTKAHDELEELMAKSNQIVISGTAYYSFNHFYDYWQQYKKIVESRGDYQKLEEVFKGSIPNDFNWKDYCVIRIPFEVVPKGFMDEKQVAQAKATVDSGTYLAEYGACFTADSNGFFRRSLIESCVVGRPDSSISHPSCGEVRFHAVLKGQPNRRYVMAIDPASEQDNFSIVILECWPDHRRIVHCWTTTRERHKAKLKRGLVSEQDFYAYAARVIRDLHKVFPCERIAIDSQGGGVSIMEALQDDTRMLPGERKILPIIDPDKPKDTDAMVGEHILEIISFASAEWVSKANHGMRKDFEDKALLFPEFDPAVVALAYEDDKAAGRIVVDSKDSSVEKLYDTLEDAVIEIELLKDELTTIVHSQTGTTLRDHWDTPEVKMPGGKKGRLRKDRYTSLLMANAVARTLARTPVYENKTTLGGFAHVMGQKHGDKSEKPYGNLWRATSPEGAYWVEQMKRSFPGGQGYGVAVRRGV